MNPELEKLKTKQADRFPPLLYPLLNKMRPTGKKWLVGHGKIKEQQAIMFAQAAAGDTIITLEVPRLARSTQQLCEIIDLVRDKHLRLVIIGSITMDCRDGQPNPMSEAFLQMAGVFS